MLSLIPTYKSVLADGQSVEVQVPGHAFGQVVAKKVRSHILMAHGLTEECVMDVVDRVHLAGHTLAIRLKQHHFFLWHSSGQLVPPHLDLHVNPYTKRRCHDGGACHYDLLVTLLIFLSSQAVTGQQATTLDEFYD